MFLSAPRINPLKVATPLAVGGIVQLPNPAPKQWLRMDTIIPAHFGCIVITVGRHYSSAPAENGFFIERVSDGYCLYEINSFAAANTYDEASYTIQRPLEGWAGYNFLSNTSGAGTINITAVPQALDLYS
ncbi:hypothetical protein NVP1107A_21 [Vibrio phage 1.107.A._10N.286.52.E10]|uniref:Uncharacterized protein n=1 Tax=Vibrio phage 1.107.A._10N.286.52.E10 TaxID=1881325 RepID=A0A2I7R319_9VIRU|nr:hypothetical protein NVP1107A_21 [Vibrio phage 1.107.A._10N.286.52.E10]